MFPSRHYLALRPKMKDHKSTLIAAPVLLAQKSNQSPLRREINSDWMISISPPKSKQNKKTITAALILKFVLKL